MPCLLPEASAAAVVVAVAAAVVVVVVAVAAVTVPPRHNYLSGAKNYACCFRCSRLHKLYSSLIQQVKETNAVKVLTKCPN